MSRVGAGDLLMYRLAEITLKTIIHVNMTILNPFFFITLFLSITSANSRLSLVQLQVFSGKNL